MAQVGIEIYVEIMKLAIPIAIAFEFCNLIVGTFMRAAFGGKLWIGAR